MPINKYRPSKQVPCKNGAKSLTGGTWPKTSTRPVLKAKAKRLGKHISKLARTSRFMLKEERMSFRLLQLRLPRAKDHHVSHLTDATSKAPYHASHEKNQNLHFHPTNIPSAPTPPSTASSTSARPSLLSGNSTHHPNPVAKTAHVFQKSPSLDTHHTLRP